MQLGESRESGQAFKTGNGVVLKEQRRQRVALAEVGHPLDRVVVEVQGGDGGAQLETWRLWRDR